MRSGLRLRSRGGRTSPHWDALPSDEVPFDELRDASPLSTRSDVESTLVAPTGRSAETLPPLARELATGRGPEALRAPEPWESEGKGEEGEEREGKEGEEEEVFVPYGTKTFRELRRRILSSLFVVIALSLGAFAFSNVLLAWLVAPGRGLRFVYLEPLEPFFTSLKIAVVFGTACSLPWVLLQLRAFLRPRLKERIEAFGTGMIAAATGLFIGGVWFAWRLVLPLGLDFLVSFGGPTLQARISIAEYTSFVLMFLLVFGLLAEMPIVLLVAGGLGLVSAEGLARHRGALIVGSFVLAAVITPPDVVTQTLLALPMLVLLEITILLMRIAGH